MASGGLLASIHNKPTAPYGQETNEVEAKDKKIPPVKDRVFDLVWSRARFRSCMHGIFQQQEV
jgi:hypothetical protein